MWGLSWSLHLSGTHLILYVRAQQTNASRSNLAMPDLLSVLRMATFTKRWQTCVVVAKSVWNSKAKIFTTWPSQKKFASSAVHPLPSSQRV